MITMIRLRKSSKKIIIIAILLFAGLFSTYLLSKDNNIYSKNANYTLMNDIYALYPTKKANIVMLGDSHTYSMNWAELFGDSKIVNRGIRGDIIPGFSARLKTILQLKPKAVCIMGGINDLYAHYSTADIIENYRELITTLRNENITVIIQSTLSVCASYSNSASVNEQVHQINISLKKLAYETGSFYCDINSSLTQNNYLLPQYSIDGLHLNAEGYKIWSDKLLPHINHCKNLLT